MVFIINPLGEREIGHLALAIFVWVMAALAFGIFGATVFAEPAVTKIEEVCGLVHVRFLCWKHSTPRTNKRERSKARLKLT
ncbi:MAG TPA: hypothetical protein VLA93_22235 [Pyrinomonadaceae bacterium]|nr:hypothetical protein [Pyrinomonadaceae bacterium]